MKKNILILTIFLIILMSTLYIVFSTPVAELKIATVVWLKWAVLVAIMGLMAHLIMLLMEKGEGETMTYKGYEIFVKKNTHFNFYKEKIETEKEYWVVKAGKLLRLRLWFGEYQVFSTKKGAKNYVDYLSGEWKK